jgi:hypothetical protein
MNILPEHLQIEVKARLLEGQSLRQIADALLISKDTVGRYMTIVKEQNGLIFCPCGQPAGHRGWCSIRYARSSARQAFIARWQASRPPAIIRLKSPPRLNLSYPFIPPQGSSSSGIDLILLVNGTVPRGLPEQLRGDVCQEIICAVVAGELSTADIPKELKRFIRSTRKKQEADYMAFSMDSPRRDGTSWHDVLPSPEDHQS